jgi:transketolase
VVSALCLETFAEQDDAYRASVLPRDVRTVSIEAGRTQPWLSLIGDRGLAIGVDRFGASAPDKVIADKFGLTTAAVAQQIERWARP